MNEPSPETTPRTYRWPRYVLALVLLGILLAIMAVIKEARRIHEIKGTDPLYEEPSRSSQR